MQGTAEMNPLSLMLARGFTEDLVLQLKYLTLIAVDIFLSRRVEQEIIIDPQGVDMPNYDADLATCDSYVAWLDFGNRAGQRGAAGAVVCAVVGVAMGLLWSESAVLSAVLGAPRVATVSMMAKPLIV